MNSDDDLVIPEPLRDQWALDVESRTTWDHTVLRQVLDYSLGYETPALLILDTASACKRDPIAFIETLKQNEEARGLFSKLSQDPVVIARIEAMRPVKPD